MSKDYSKLNKEELLDLIKKLKNHKKYGIVWEEEKEPEEVVLNNNRRLTILKEIKSKRIIKNKNKAVNILIEGDNYNALEVLNYTHKEKIDVIYIDPPYNTGKKDEWKYNDRYVGEDDDYRHSKWLNFMYKRLLLAKNLLHKNGVIFISIGNDEFAQLKLLCDEIFDEKNFVNNLIWEKVKIRKNSALYFTDNHDYILCYAKKKKGNENDYGWDRQLIKRINNNYKNPDNDPNGPWMRGSITANNAYSADYEIKKPNGVILKKPKNSYWRYSYEKFQEFVTQDRVLWGKADSYPMVKKYLKDAKDGLVPKSILSFNEYGGNPDGANELKEIFGGDKVFTNPKPSKLILNLIKLATPKKDAIILDFFAGSGSTGQAVFALNEEDGGNRKFILCTNNEGKICEEVTFPRISKIINGYDFKGKDKKIIYENKLTVPKINNFSDIKKEIDEVKENNESNFDKIDVEFNNNTIYVYGINKVENKKDGLKNNLSYFKTDHIDIQSIKNVSDKNKIELTYRAGWLIAVKENYFEEVETNEYWQIFKNDNKLLAIYFKEDQSKLEQLFKKMKDKGGVVYLFAWGKNELNSVDYDYPNIEIKDIPQPIIEVYKEINKL